MKWLTIDKKSDSGIMDTNYYDYKLKKDVPSYYIQINGASYDNTLVKLFTEKDFIDYLEYRFSISIRTMRERDRDGDDRNQVYPYAVYIDDQRTFAIEQHRIGLELTVGIVNETIIDNPKRDFKTKLDGLINTNEIINSFFDELISNKIQRQIITDNILDNYKNHGYIHNFLISEISLDEYKKSLEENVKRFNNIKK